MSDSLGTSCDSVPAGSALGLGCRLAVLAIVLSTSASTSLHAAFLKPETARSFARYAAAVEARIANESGATGPFLSADRPAGAGSWVTRATLIGGEVIVDGGVTPRDAANRELEIDGGQINHWRGAVFVPKVTLEVLLANLMEPNLARHKQEDVLRSEVRSRNGDALQVYLRLRRSGIVTVVYDTEYDVRYHRLSPTRASSRSLSTKIVEVEDPGTPQERTRPEGDDHGYMWRLYSYWKYEQVDGGVIVEVETLTLSRDLPFLLIPIGRPIIRHIARETLGRTLASMRDRFKDEGVEAPRP